MGNKKIYIAGFDVFMPLEYAKLRGQAMKRVCNLYGFEGLYPLDNESTNSKDIFEGNIKLIDKCDYIVANLNPFRGKEMDCGTAFELGYGKAKGKILLGYRDWET